MFCKGIFEAGRVPVVTQASHDAIRFRHLEAIGKRIRSDPGQAFLQVLESSRAVQKQVSQDQHCPTVADDVYPRLWRPLPRGNVTTFAPGGNTHVRDKGVDDGAHLSVGCTTLLEELQSTRAA